MTFSGDDMRWLNPKHNTNREKIKSSVFAFFANFARKIKQKITE